MCNLKINNVAPATARTLSDASGGAAAPSGIQNKPLLATKRHLSTLLDGYVNSPKKRKLDLSELHSKRLIQATRAPNRSVEQIEKLLQSEDINQTDEIMQNTALHFAAFYNSLSIAKLLVRKGANLNAQNNSGATPLMWAIEKGHTAFTKYLLRLEHIDIGIADKQGFTSLHKAVLNGNLEILRTLLQVSGTHPEFDINALSGQGLSALHQAAYHGNVSALKLLCRHGANVDVASSNRTTALHLAATRNQSEIVSILLEHSAKVDLQDAHSRSALHYACMFGHYDCARVLFEAGANSALEDFQNQSPKLIAERDGIDDLISLFTPVPLGEDYFDFLM